MIACEPSTRDVIAGVLEPLLKAGWVSPLAIADALIAAGLTMPETICGATTVRDGVDLTCDSPPGHDGDHCADFGIHWWPYEP